MSSSEVNHTEAHAAEISSSNLGADPAQAREGRTSFMQAQQEQEKIDKNLSQHQ